MNNKLKATLILTSLAVFLVFTVIAEAQIQQRSPVNPPVDAPKVESKDKGEYNQGVCNSKKKNDGTVDHSGSVAAFHLIPDQVLCQDMGQAYLIGCDLTSKEACVSNDGKPGFWATCYYMCPYT
tara:strand:+ start:1748 stop:2119 length:372 start_codon:yes stop_codon:yes gene_type:complete